MAARVVWYEDARGRRPVQEFLDALKNVKHRAAILAAIMFLAEKGVTLGDPYTSQVEGRLRELKADFGKHAYRVLYYWNKRRELVLLHALLKKTRKLPQRDRRLGIDRMNRDSGS